MTEILFWAGAIVAMSAAIGALTKWVFKPLWRLLRGVQRFLTDWFGEEARPGVERRPGMPERVAQIEWHIGNGRDVPLRQVVDRTAVDLHDHLADAAEDRRKFARVSRRVGLDDNDGGDGDDLKP